MADEAVLKAVDEHTYLFFFVQGIEEKSPDDVMLAILGRRIRFKPWIYKMMLETPAENLIADKRICLLIRASEELNVTDAVLTASKLGMIPVFQERLPHDDKIKVVYDNLLDIPRDNEAAASAAKGHWMNFLSACQISPQDSLSEFSKEMSALTAKCGNENKLRVRIYLLRFQAGGQEVVHPTAVLVSP